MPITRQGLEQTALLLLAGAVLFALLALRRRRAGAAWRRSAISAGLLSACATVVLGLGYTLAPNIPTPPVPITARFATNPAPDEPAVWDRGKASYQKNCVICHGPKGLGDGPQAFLLNPRPFNLQVHVPLHAPGEVYYWIGEGVPGTTMPSWKGILTETERWELVRYLYALAAGRM